MSSLSDAPNMNSTCWSPPISRRARAARGGTYSAVYNGTKAFIDSFSFALRAELKDTGHLPEAEDQGETKASGHLSQLTLFKSTFVQMELFVGRGFRI
jgi:hypothetical protein